MQKTMSAWIIVLLLSQHRVHQAAGSDPDGESCEKKIISCIQCSTDSGDAGSTLCSDPFDARVQKEFKRMYDTSPVTKQTVARYNITTVLCDGFCVKWVKTTVHGAPLSVLRTCSTNLDMRFAQTASVCIFESRTGKGQMCFCREALCNSGRVDWQPTIVTLAAVAVASLAPQL